ncbi:MAG: thermonuclease family protein [Candidatus Altarchaeum sp.]|nr:thermonuclease family protein [Candidatus Altarchaeum sp.]
MSLTKKLFLITVAIIVLGICLFLVANYLDLNQIFHGKNGEIIIDYVTSVHDGDTIYTQNLSESIRVLHIDTPEIPPAGKDYYGIEARDFLKSEILKKNIKLKCKGKDKYNRNLCEIYPIDADADDIKESYNYQMVKKGYACPFMTENKEIKNAGIEARNKKIGIFSENSTYKCRDEF